MKRFLLHTALFALIVALTLGVGEWIVRHSGNPYRLKKEYMDAHAADISTLILGHSQTYYGIDPEALDSAFNLAMVSQSPAIDSMLLARYAPSLSSLRHVVMPVTYTSLLEADLGERDEWWRLISYRLYMDLPIGGAVSPYSAELCHLPSYAGKLGVALSLKKSSFLTDSLGHGDEYALRYKAAGTADGATIARLHTASLSADRLDINTRRLMAVDSICRSLGARLIVVTPPVREDYRQNIDPALWELTTQRLRSLPLEWHDFSDDPRFGGDDFFDGDHLTSDVGAARFTAIIDSIISR